MSTERVNKSTAIVLHYNGIEPHRVECFDSSKPVFLVKVPHFDFEAIKGEMTDPSQPVYLAAFLASVAAIDSLLDQARPSGVWNAPREIEVSK